MKRTVPLLAVIVCAVAFYLVVYPRLANSNAVSAADTSSSASSAPSGRAASGRTGGPATAVVTATVATQTVPVTQTDVGFIEAPNVAVVRTRADGIVVQQSVTEGQMVKTGDVLLKLDDTSAQAAIAKDQALLAKDTATAESAQLDLSRDQDLAQKQAGTQQAVDQQTAVVKGTQANILIDEAQIKSDQLLLSYMTITAPIDGRVGTINTSVGNVVRAADTSADGLLSITDMSSLRASFPVSERNLQAFRNALAQGNVPVQILAPGDSKPRAMGKLSFIDSSVDTASGTVVMKADIQSGADQLWPGQYVSTVTQTSAYTNATTTPLVAVQQSSSGSYVFVVGSDGTVHKVSVTVVATLGDIAVVGPELKPGDHVVTEGQLRLTDGSRVTETSAAQAAASSGVPAASNNAPRNGGKRASSAGASSASSAAPTSSAGG